MLDIQLTSSFGHDLRLLKKRGMPLEKLEAVVNLLATGEPLPEKYKAHRLSGQWNGAWECHVAPDWLLIYKINERALILLLSRTGIHADLFR